MFLDKDKIKWHNYCVDCYIASSYYVPMDDKDGIVIEILDKDDDNIFEVMIFETGKKSNFSKYEEFKTFDEASDWAISIFNEKYGKQE